MTAKLTNQLLLCRYEDFDFTRLERTYFSLLNEDEVERFHRIKHRDTQKQFFLTRIVLKQQLEKITGCSPDSMQFQTSKYGRPSLVGSSIDFNVSHTKNLIAIALNTQGRIGVDVENIGRNSQYSDIAQHYFHEKECEQIGNSATAFFKIWTLKEAYIKTLGLGLQKPLKSFYFTFNSDKKIALNDTAPEEFLQFKMPFISGYSVSFAEQFQLAWIQFSFQRSGRTLPEVFQIDSELNTTAYQLTPDLLIDTEKRN